MLIPGWIISLVTFPGVIAHEIAHKFFCDLAGVRVYDVCYFRIGDPAGFVVHGDTRNLRNSFFISIGPLLVNTVLCALLTFSGIFPLIILGAEKYNHIFILLLWVGYSIGMHAFPSNEDADNFILDVESMGAGIFYWMSMVFVGLINIANVFRFIWFDLIYAVGISLLLPFALASF